MQGDLQKMLQKAQLLEESGERQHAREFYLNLFDGTEAETPIILFQWASFLFRGGEYEQALEVYIRCHKTGSLCTEIEAIVLEAFHRPNMNIFEKCYSQNIACFHDHVGIDIGEFPEFSSLSFRFLPYSKNKYAIFDNSAKKFLYDVLFTDVSENTGLQYPTVFLLKNEFNMHVIEKQLEACLDEHFLEYIKTKPPLYLAYNDRNIFIEFLQVTPFYSLSYLPRCVFFFDTQQISDYFSLPDVLFPIYYLNMDGEADPFFRCVEGLRQKKFQSGDVDYQNLMLFFAKEFVE